MIINLNGEKKEVPDGITVAGLLELLKIQHQRVAVELNTEVVRKEKFDTMAIHEEDTLEVVSFMAGGAITLASREPQMILRSCENE